MTSESDDALSWDGDEATGSQEPALPRDWNAVGKGDKVVGKVEDDGTITAADDAAPAGLGRGVLLVLGVVGGVYLLYTIGWVVGGLRLKPLASFLVDDAMFLPWFILAIAAPAVWFLASWVLTRNRASWIRIVALLAGVVLLVPWPFVTVGVVGA